MVFIFYSLFYLLFVAIHSLSFTTLNTPHIFLIFVINRELLDPWGNMVVLFKRLCWVPFLNSEIISRFPSVFATREDIGTTSATAGDSLKTLPKKTDSILLISALGILLDTPPSSRNGYAFGFLLFLSGQQHHFSHILQGGITMISQQGGFKEVIKKAFPEADFSQWSKILPPPPTTVQSLFILLTRFLQKKVPSKNDFKRSRIAEKSSCILHNRKDLILFKQRIGITSRVMNFVNMEQRNSWICMVGWRVPWSWPFLSFPFPSGDCSSQPPAGLERGRDSDLDSEMIRERSRYENGIWE